MFTCEPESVCYCSFSCRIETEGLVSCGVVCVILRLAVSVENRLVTDRHMTTAYTALAWRLAVKIVESDQS